MATKKHSSRSRALTEKLSAEERNLVHMYRWLSRWERNATFLVLQSIAWGRLDPDRTDKMSWPQISRIAGLPKEARHASQKL